MVNSKKLNVNNLVQHDFCTGCGSCWQACSNHSIDIVVDREGFNYPSVNSNSCINCGNCIKCCPILNLKFVNDNEPECYSIQAIDSLRLKGCTSGGVFSAIADSFIDSDSYVCGVVFDNKSNSAKHYITNKKRELKLFRGSKYIQSYDNNSFIDIKNLLDVGKNILFSGTPCQVAGLKAYLKQDYKNLYCVDLICEGVPSPGVFNKYINGEFKQGTLDEAIFRDKKVNGWHDFHVKFQKGNKIISENLLNNDFTSLFLHSVINRPSCSTCPFQTIPRQGDITIGDFWGIENFDPKIDDDKGTSVVLVNNFKGKKLLDLGKEYFLLIKKQDIELAKRSNPNLIKPTKPHPNRALAFNLINKDISISDIRKYSLGNKCDVAILNVWFAKNYGALLTCYALYKILKDKGYIVKVINYMPKSWENIYRDSFCEHFAERHLCLTNKFDSVEELDILNKDVDNFIAGSDQLWRYEIYKNHGGNIYQLDFVRSNKNKIACAVSFGEEEFSGPDEEKQILRSLINEFSSVSVRECSGKKILKEMGIDSDVLCDPVFAVTKNDWLKIAETPKKHKDYFATYILAGGHEDKFVGWIDNIIRIISKKYKIKPVRLTFKRNYSAEQWLGYLANSKFIVTDSFHAACFSIIFNKPLVYLVNYSNIYQRLDSIFKKYDINATVIFKNKKMNINSIKVPNSSFSYANKIIQNDKLYFEEWIDKALKKKSKLKNDTLIRKLTFQRNINNILVNELQSANQNMNNEVLAYKDLYYNMINSFSWRITKPYRYISRNIKAIVKRFKSL